MPIKARNNGKALPAKLVFSRSLEYFYKKAREDISNSTQLSCIDSEIKWILTVPAIWGEKAREFMRQAAEEVRSASHCLPVIQKLYSCRCEFAPATKRH